MSDVCTHLDTIAYTELPDQIAGCEDCLRIGGRWLHLRMCTNCGHIGCCDSSVGQHATRHFQETGHPVMRSVMPGADWTWCYVHELTGQLG